MMFPKDIYVTFEIASFLHFLKVRYMFNYPHQN
jgi:hypothetical protein